MSYNTDEESAPIFSLAFALKAATDRGYITKNIDKEGDKPEEKSTESRRSRSSRYRNSKPATRAEKEYNPEINLEYIDDDGKRLDTPKEAFRYMSHKFHGNGPKKNKIDKRLKKQELESKIKAACTIDATLKTEMFEEKAKELNSPYIVLSKKS